MKDYNAQLVNALALEGAQLRLDKMQLQYELEDLKKELAELKAKEEVADGNT